MARISLRMLTCMARPISVSTYLVSSRSGEEGRKEGKKWWKIPLSINGSACRLKGKRETDDLMIAVKLFQKVC